jgi:hypothetical protein
MSGTDALALVAWLRDQLDRDEAIAQACPPWPWRLEYDDSTDITASPGRSRGALLDANEDAPSLVVSDPYGEVGPAHEHIATFDPARVLKEVQAKRLLLDLHVPQGRGELMCCKVCDVGYHSCGCVGWGDWPCETLKLLAQPYSDRPGYLDSWAVS